MGTTSLLMSKKSPPKADSKKPRGILDEHRRVGKKYLPPITELRNLKPVSYINQLLPEILWMGLINDALGYREGIRLFQALAVTAKKIHQSEKQTNFALCSSYLKLSEVERAELLKRLAEDKSLEQLKSCLAPLTIHYNGFPLAFLGMPADPPDRTILLKKLKRSIERHIVKYETPALAIQAAVVYIRAITGGLQLNSKMSAPDLDSIITSPESENAKKASAFVRSFVLMEVSLAGEDYTDAWARSFWNHGIELDDCEFEVRSDE